MPVFSTKKLLGILFSALFVLVVVFLDPDGKVLDGFEKNYEKSYYFEDCEKGIATSTSSFLDVVSVADGDTLTVSLDCEPVTVRMMGVDTPETVDPRRPVQCFGIEASNFTKAQLEGKKVRIETDETQDTYDKYGRLLGYVILEDGANFNLRLVEEGYAHEYTYQGEKYRYQKEFKEAEVRAKENKRGLWGARCEQ